MSYVFMWTDCIGCGVQFSCNNVYVPSLPINGERHPICRSCFNRWNSIHRPNNPLPLHPLAYEPIPESDMGNCIRGSEYTGKSSLSEEEINNLASANQKKEK